MISFVDSNTASLPVVPSPVRRYALAGTGVRGHSFAQAILRDFPHMASLVALYDLNLSRMKGFSKILKSELECFQDFDEMVRATNPHTLIICTPDATHDQLIELAFSRGLEVIVEKPLTTTLEKLGRIFRLEQKYGRKVRVAFNCRYMPFFLEVKKLLMTNPIGEIKSINMEAAIDLHHGLEYFRRWHAEQQHSGGLLIHKSTHHFDIVNWLVDDTPAEVMALGSLQVFGRNGKRRGSNCRTCEHRAECAYVHRPDWEGIEPIYFQAEHEDGYLRDRCVFREEVDICDTMNVTVRYRRGAQFTYSLVAYSPSAGCRLSITGTEGRIETERYFRGRLSPNDHHTIRIGVGAGGNFHAREIIVPPAEGPHEGGDTRLFSDIFGGAEEDPWAQCADSKAGAMSCLIGIMANQSILSGKSERIPTREEISASVIEQNL